MAPDPPPRPPAPDPAASVVVVTYDSATTIADCLAPLADDPRFELVVVDNASRDDTVGIVRTVAPNAHLIASPVNEGFAAGVDRGARRARGEVLVLLNPDTRTTGDDLWLLVERARRPGTGVAAPRIVDAGGRVSPSTRRQPRLIDQIVVASGLHRLLPPLDPDREPRHVRRATGPVAVEVVSGACFATPRCLFEELGGLDTRFFLYAEEVDYCVRVRARGLDVELVPDSRVVHLGGVSTERATFSASAMLRVSRVRYFHKHHGRRAAAITRRVWQMAALVRLPLALVAAPPGRRRRAARSQWEVARALAGPLDELLATP